MKMILSNKYMRINVLLLFTILMIFYVPAHADTNAGFMDDLLSQISNQAQGFRATFATAAISIYVMLVAIELALDTGQEMLRGSGVGKFAGMIIVRFFMMMVWIAIIKDPNIVTSVITQAMSLASDAGGVKDLTPSKTAGLGVVVFDKFMAAIKGTSFSLADPMLILFGLVILFVGFAIIVLFALMGLMFFITTVESTFVLAVGVIMLGFLGSTWTNQNGKAYISYVIAVSVKLIVTILLVSLIMNVTKGWAAKVASTTDLFALINVSIEIVLNAMVLLFLVMTIPALAASICTGVSTASLTGALAAGGAVMAAGGMLAAGAGMLADGFKGLSSKGMDPGDIDMDTGSPGGDGGGGSDGGPSESMSPQAESPAAPGSEGNEGGISSGENTGTGSLGTNGEKKGTNALSMLKNQTGKGIHSLKEAEGHTTVQPPSFSSKHSDF